MPARATAGSMVASGGGGTWRSLAVPGGQTGGSAMRWKSLRHNGQAGGDWTYRGRAISRMERCSAQFVRGRAVTLPYRNSSAWRMNRPPAALRIHQTKRRPSRLRQHARTWRGGSTEREQAGGIRLVERIIRHARMYSCRLIGMFGAKTLEQQFHSALHPLITTNREISTRSSSKTSISHLSPMNVADTRIVSALVRSKKKWTRAGSRAFTVPNRAADVLASESSNLV